MSHLRKGTWRHLRYLYLNYNHVDGEGVEILGDNMWKLQSLGIRGLRYLEGGLHYDV